MRAWPAVIDRAGAALDRLAELAREGVDVPGVLEREDEVVMTNDVGIRALSGALRVRMADGETTAADELARALVQLARAVEAEDLAPCDLRAVRVVDLARDLGVLIGGGR